MALIIEKQVLEGDSASLSGENATHSLKYFIRFDTNISNSLQAISAANFFIGQEHPTASGLSLESITANPIDGKNWMFECEYSNAKTYSNPDGSDENYRPEISWGSWQQEVAIPLTNAADDLFDPPPTRVIYWQQIRITKFEPNPYQDRLLLQGHFNSAQFSLVGITVPEYCAMLAGYDTQPETDSDDEEYFRNTFIINLCFKKSADGLSTIGFKQEYINAGYNTKSAGGDKAPIVFPTGEQAETPQLLTANGQSTTDTPNYILYTPEETTDFTVFGLPVTFQRR